MAYMNCTLVNAVFCSEIQDSRASSSFSTLPSPSLNVTVCTEQGALTTAVNFAIDCLLPHQTLYLGQDWYHLASHSLPGQKVVIGDSTIVLENPNAAENPSYLSMQTHAGTTVQAHAGSKVQAHADPPLQSGPSTSMHTKSVNSMKESESSTSYSIILDSILRDYTTGARASVFSNDLTVPRKTTKLHSLQSLDLTRNVGQCMAVQVFQAISKWLK